MIKKIDCHVIYLLMDLIYISSFASGHVLQESQASHLMRQKRNIICFFGINDVLKDMLYDSLEDLHKHDPVKLGNSSDGKLEDGVFQGLSTLTNISDLNVDCDDDSVVFSTTLGMEEAVVHFKWRRKYLIDLDGSVWSRAREINFDVEIRLIISNEVKFDVTKILINKLDGFEFGISGLGPLNPIVKGFVHMMHKVWSSRVTRVIQNLLRKALEKQLGMLTFAL